MSASGIRAGSAFVEIFLKDSKFQQGLTSVQAKMAAAGTKMRQIGTQMAMGGAMIGAPMLLALRTFASFDDVLRATRASTGMTAGEFEKLRSAALEMSKELGIDPTEVASGFMELLKAGMSLEQVLGGAGKAAIQFATVAGMSVADAAVVMADAMNVFGVSSENAANTLSSAADASSTDIQGIALAFSQVSAVAGLANQSIDDTAAALAILANAGVKGSDAGTSLKTMLMRLMAPAEDAAEALREVGLDTNSFRNVDGTMRPMVDIIGTLTTAMDGMNQAAKDDIFRRIFGQDAIRAAAVLTSAGVSGFEAMQNGMGGALSVGQKFEEMMAGISGAMESAMAGLRRLAIAFGTALAPTMVMLGKAATAAADAVAALFTQFPLLAQIAGAVAGGLFGLGVAAIVGGLALQVFAKGIGVLKAVLSIIPALCTPVGAAIVGIGAAVATAVVVARTLSPAFKRETDGIMTALMSLDFASAWKIMNLNFAIALQQMVGVADEKLRQVHGFFAAAGALIGDKLTEGLDRFMGLFGADIITLQTGLQKLGLYMRAAFDWKFWATGLKGAVADVEAEAARQRQNAPTADARAANRTKARQEAADGRQAQIDGAQAANQAIVDELRKELEAVHEGLKPKVEEPEAEKKATGQPRPKTEGGPQNEPPAAGAAGAGDGIGRTLGTFGSAAGLAIGPELANLQSPAEATADNTAKMAAQMEGLLGADAAKDAALGRGALPAGIDMQLGDGAIAGDVPRSMLAGTPAFRGAAAEARKASDAVSSAAGSTTTSASVLAALREIVAAVNAHAGLTAAGNQTLGEINGKIERLGSAFA